MTLYLDASNSSKNCWFDTWIVSYSSTEILTHLWLKLLFLLSRHSFILSFSEIVLKVNVRGWTFDFWGEGGDPGRGMGDFRRKYPADWFWGKKNILQRKTWGEKYIALKKHQYMLGKKVQRFGKKKSYPNQITHSLSKVKWSTSNAISARMLVFLQFFRMWPSW